MKKTLFAVLGSLLVATLAVAGDDYVQTLTTTDSAVQCSQRLRVKDFYSVQCKSSACHVAASTFNDGGGTPANGQTVSTSSVLVNANVLYDVETTGYQPYICVMGQDGGVVSADIYYHTGVRN